MPRITDFIKLLRPHQQIKNGFVLLGVMFSHQWDAPTLMSASISLLAFCAMSGAVYVLNDIIDVDADRQHPEKRRRPIASNIISVRMAWCYGVALAACSLALGASVGRLMPLLLGIYLVLNIAYSIRLKHIVILDVFIISAGFMLRILAGTLGLAIPPSHWLLLCGLMLTLFLGFTKRRAELSTLEPSGKLSQSSTRQVLDDYTPVMLEQYIAVSAACTILSYSLYTVSNDTMAFHGSGNLIYTVPFVVYGIFRYLFLLHHGSQGIDAARDLLTDRHLLLTVAGWLAACLGVLL